ncbi:MAG: tetratricopeptide repeat protein [Balneolaceae bacterium]|nr:tetratricopeptide repeat protein [Balneolaceae bacterium]
MAFELQDFKNDVLKMSRETPVVIDFWAEWCGPCRQLGPAIEKLANQAGDRWKLVKINTDEHPAIASQFGVRGIPSVKMVYQEEVVAEFTGALPEPAIRRWLEENLPDGDVVNTEEILEQADELLEDDKRVQARELLADVVDEDADEKLKVRYAMLLLPDEIKEAEQWMNQVTAIGTFDIELQVLETVKHLKEVEEGNADPAEGPPEVIEAYRRGASELVNGEFEAALPRFIELLHQSRELDDEGPRKACIACFTMLGERHPLTKQYRRKFSMALY